MVRSNVLSDFKTPFAHAVDSAHVLLIQVGPNLLHYVSQILPRGVFFYFPVSFILDMIPQVILAYNQGILPIIPYVVPYATAIGDDFIFVLKSPTDILKTGLNARNGRQAVFCL